MRRPPTKSSRRPSRKASPSFRATRPCSPATCRSLIDLQKKHNVALLYDASSCGSIPVIRNLEEYYDNDLLLEVKGILNGLSNYILSRVFDHQESYDAALAQAQALGFAESDPSFDIEGYDSLFKLVIITVHALGVYVHPDRIFTYGISTIHDSDIRYAREKGVKIKLVAQVVKVSDRKFTMFVMPEFVTPANTSTASMTNTTAW